MSKAIRPIRIEGEIAYVTLTRGKVAVIDAADAHLVEGRNWCAQKGTTGGFYAVTNIRQSDGRRAMVWLHRTIMSLPDGVRVDHKDGDGLNCRRENMRPASHGQNVQNIGRRSHNKSGFKGVWLHKQSGRWRAAIRANGTLYDLGLHATPQIAHEVYCSAAERLHGQFRRTS